MVLFIFISSGDSGVSSEERKLEGFKAHLIKKKAAETSRIQFAEIESIKRKKNEQKYELARENFKRPVSTTPAGLDAYEKKILAAERRYIEARDKYAKTKTTLDLKLSEKMDATKMVEYEL